MSSDCVTECAPNRDTSYFELKTSIRSLHDLPRFPAKDWLEEMTPNERQIVAGLYIGKMADLLMGVNDERELHELTELREMDELVRGLTEEE